MNETKRTDRSNTVYGLLKVGVSFILVITLVMMGIAIFDKNNSGEASIGSFEAKTLNEGWKLTRGKNTVLAKLPITVRAQNGDMIVVSNTLPSDIHDGMNLMIRSAMEDIKIFINGKERTEYSSDSLKDIAYYIPSAWNVIPLNASDAGAMISIELTVKNKGVINEVTYGDGNNVWFPVIKNALIVNAVAFLVLLFSILLLASIILLGNTYNIDSIRALGFLMMDVSLWIFSESHLRQLLYSRPSLTLYFSYLTMEIIGVLACMFFDEVQHRHHHKKYLIVESIAFLQLFINVTLQLTGVMELHETLVMSHVWTVVCFLTSLGCIISDFASGRIKQYRITAIGIIAFLVFSMGELLEFYFSSFIKFGSYICMGLLVLMIATIIQTVTDGSRDARIREKKWTDMTFNTIETIAASLDAKDEYTGGHSERVGYYAQRLAREMAADYEFSEDDILRIHYIGLVHDIGKIGVADNVLNKSGRLSEEEFSLMRKHSEIGYEIMTSFGSDVEGLLEGIRFHHERFDGTGYPDALCAEEIPLVARILALADSYDAMTSNRVYRKRLSDEEVKNEIKRCSGTQFDPNLAQVFIRLIECGEIVPQTTAGIAVNEKGDISMASLLETILQKDMHDKIKIKNPSHVRMMCYIIKLMEKKGKYHQVVFTDSCSEDPEVAKSINAFAAKMIGYHDMIVRYTDTRSIIALFDRTEAERDSFMASIKQEFAGAKVWPLYEPENAKND